MSDSSCIFCRIAAGEIPAKLVYEDEQCVAFHDLNPQAPVHILVIPRRHIASLADARPPEDEAALGQVMLAAARVAGEQGLSAAGFRAVVNTGAGAGQSVFHLHVHVLGGRPLAWPPG